MSISDDREKAMERLLEGRERNVESGFSYREPTQEEKDAWNSKVAIIKKQISEGVISSEEWRINGLWVELKGGRSFPLKEEGDVITRERINNYLSAHNICLDNQEIKMIWIRLANDNPALAKGKLK